MAGRSSPLVCLECGRSERTWRGSPSSPFLAGPLSERAARSCEVRTACQQICCCQLGIPQHNRLAVAPRLLKDRCEACSTRPRPWSRARTITVSALPLVSDIRASVRPVCFVLFCLQTRHTDGAGRAGAFFEGPSVSPLDWRRLRPDFTDACNAYAAHKGERWCPAPIGKPARFCANRSPT